MGAAGRGTAGTSTSRGLGCSAGRGNDTAASAAHPTERESASAVMVSAIDEDGRVALRFANNTRRPFILVCPFPQHLEARSACCPKLV